jgi:hypothetical protein
LWNRPLEYNGYSFSSTPFQRIAIPMGITILLRKRIPILLKKESNIYSSLVFSKTKLTYYYYYYFYVNNDCLSSVVPTGLWSLPNLSIIDFSMNNFEGPLSSFIGKAKSIAQLLANNRFSWIIYQRSRGRFSKASQARAASWLSGQTSGQLTSRGVLGMYPFASPVRLNFDGGEEEPRKSGVDSSSAGILGETPISSESVPGSGTGAVFSSAGILGSTPNSSEIVPESEFGAESLGMGLFGASSGEAEELKLALEVGGIVGMTCDGQVGHLKEVLGQLVAKKHGRGIGGERDSHVINES